MCIFLDYESISEVINSKRDESGKSLTLPRYHPFKVPLVPERKSSVDGKFNVFQFITLELIIYRQCNCKISLCLMYCACVYTCLQFQNSTVLGTIYLWLEEINQYFSGT